MNEQKLDNYTGRDKKPKKETDFQLAVEYLENLTTSPSFSAYLQESGVDITVTQSDEYLKKIHDFSKLFLADISPDQIDSSHKLLELAALTPYAARQSQLLSLNDSERILSKKEVGAAKDTTIEFGTLMADYMAINPDVSIDDLSDTLTRINSEYTEDDPAHVHPLIYSKVRGARIEYIFEDLMKDQDILHIRRGTVEEDRRGIDFVATTEQGEAMFIDVKASMEEIAKNNGGYSDENKIYSVGRQNRVFLFPAVGDGFFIDGTCRLEEDLRAPITMQLLGSLYKASQEITQRE